MDFAKLRFSLMGLGRVILVSMLGIAVAVGIGPKIALAEVAPIHVTPMQPAPVHLALAASSRFAAPSDEELEIQKMSERRREELREKRRQWQNQASEAAVEKAEEERAAEEVAEKKLNLQEIAEENPVTN